MKEVIVLAILQGVAEFLPISSSGHLVIGQHLLGLHDGGMRLDIFLHLGTLISICIFYFSVLRRIILKLEWEYALKIVLSAIPAIIVYILFKDFVDGLFENAKMVGALLMFTGAVLVGTRYIPKGNKNVSFIRALLMGLGQALALLPGISRSGTTLACARAGGVEPEKSAEFSFLMSAPLIAGGAFLEVLKALKTTEGVSAATEISWNYCVIGAVIAAIVGYFSLKFLVASLKSRWFWLFGPYCLTAGLLTLILI